MDLYDWVFPRRSISPIEYQQDLNLHYVGVTRAKRHAISCRGLIDIDLIKMIIMKRNISISFNKRGAKL